jgi:hypothetical protein
MGYQREDIEAFVVSCRTKLPDATIVVFTSNLDSETTNWIRGQSSVEVIWDNFNPHQVHRGWRLAAFQIRARLGYFLVRHLLGDHETGLNSKSARLAESLFSIVIQRFFRYRRYLHEHAAVYSHALLADMRDVIFQADPFPCAGLHVFAENETIGNSHFARRWFQLAYGWNSWRPYAERPLLNVGTTLGDINSVLQYLDAACGEYVRTRAFFWGADTAIHNRLIHDQSVPATVNEFGNGSVLTLNAIPLEQLQVKNGQVLNHQGSPYPVLHQFDRVVGLNLPKSSTKPPFRQHPE